MTLTTDDFNSFGFANAVNAVSLYRLTRILKSVFFRLTGGLLFQVG